MIFNIIFGIVAVACIAYCFFYTHKSKKKDLTLYYKAIVKFIGGNKSTLLMNEQLYEVFKNWTNQPQGIFTIDDSSDKKEWKHMTILDKKYVASIEIKKIYKQEEH